VQKKKENKQMKKLMVMAAVAMAAVVSQAATVSWGSDVITEPGGAVANKTVTGYLFVLTADQYNTLNAAYAGGTAASAGEKMNAAVWAAYGDKLASADATGVTSKQGKRTLIDPSAYSAGNTAYAALIYTYGSGDDMYYMGNIGSAYVESDMDVDMSYMGTKLFGNESGTATAWTAAAVPEPTSGLLLLLGMAGLALKRKRA